MYRIYLVEDDQVIAGAIAEGKFYAAGQTILSKTTGAKERIDEAMALLVESVYTKLSYIDQLLYRDDEVQAILQQGTKQMAMDGMPQVNSRAAEEMGQYLELQARKHMPVTMGDIQRRFSAAPYGWREIDIAALIARLVAQQKISIKYGGAVVGKDERRLVDYLRKKSEIDKAVVTRRIAPSEDLIRKSVTLLRDYLGAMDIPSDEDGLIRFVIATLEDKQRHYQQLLDNAYSRERYPQREDVTAARDLMQNILSQRRDNVALLTRLAQKQDDLLDSAEDLEDVEMFFGSQRVIFDDARRQMDRVSKERDYFSTDADAQEIFRTVSTILAMPKPYDRIGELPALVVKVREKYDALLDVKRDEVTEIVRQGMQDVHELASEARDADALLRQADDWFVKKREALKEATSLTDLDAMITQVLNYKDTICRRMEPMVARDDPKHDEKDDPRPKKIQTIRRYDLCAVKRLRSEEDIDKYVDEIKRKLLNALDACDELQIN